jgi:hypothetical protein
MYMKMLPLWALSLAWAVMLAPNGNSQIATPKAANMVKLEIDVMTANPAPTFDRTNRPDPFLSPQNKRKRTDADEELPKGEAPPGIAGMNTTEVELLGLSLSSEAKTAAFRGTDKRVYFLHEGDRLFDGYLKTVHIDSVLLIRETKLRSGKVLAQEMTKRLRNQ